ncbi:MAG: GWxTD domain-containing protein, partial [Acidobacteriota bacterium]
MTNHRFPVPCRTKPSSRLGRVAAVVTLLLVTGVSGAFADEDELSRKERNALIEALPEKYQQWLDEVQFLISDEERDLFVQLEKDYLRDAFIEKFWKVRDPYPRTPRNELKENYAGRLQQVQQV